MLKMNAITGQLAPVMDLVDRGVEKKGYCRGMGSD